MRNVFLILITFICNLSCLSQIALENGIYQLDLFDDNITPKEAIEKYKKGEFNIPFKNEIYKTLTNKEANWICINITKQTEKQFISIENSLFEVLDFYISKDTTTITKLNDLKEQFTYRFPLVEITPSQTPSVLFIRTKDAKSYRTEFSIKNYNEQSLQITSQRDYFFIGAYVLALFVLIISATIFLLYKKQLVVLWYLTHLVVLICEYLISTGIFSQWFIDNSFILKFGLDHITLLLSTLALSEFFRNFYNYSRKTIFCKKIYLAITLACGLGIIYSIIDGFTGNSFNVELYAQTVLNIASIITLAIHFILVFSNVIPIYLFVAFLLPVLGIFANLGGLKDQFTNPNIIYFIFQSVYLGILMEVIVIIFYIIKQSIDGELKAVSLAQENNILKNNFQNELSKNQDNHKNALMNDVHDSFGGYIEALKLRLQLKNIYEKDVNDILDSFRNDYRMLLNSLYSPKINTSNFIDHIQEYCSKMNELSAANITFSYEDTSSLKLSQTLANLIFKSASELTTNALKYAKASNINVSLHFSKSSLTLKIKDDGKGFILKPESFSGYGLKNLKKRITDLEGVFDLKSDLGMGTHILITLPILNS